MNYWLYAYQEGDEGALRELSAIALDWHRFHVKENRRSTYEWDNMATGLRASRLAFILDNILIGNLDVGDNDLASLMVLAELHVEQLMEPSFLSWTNHALFQLAGLNALCAVISWRSVCDGAASYASEEMARLMKEWFTDEGVHLENSPNYHAIVLEAMRRLNIAERFELPEVRQVIELGGLVTPWLTYPDGRWVPVGDSEGTVGDSEGSGVPLRGPVEPVCLDGAGGCWAVRDLTKSGYAIIRSVPGTDAESSMLFVNAMGAAISHKHSDDLGFVLLEAGREIFTDSGKYSYNKDEKRRYFVSTQAHNVPSLEDLWIDPRRIDRVETGLQPIRVDGPAFVVEGLADRPKLFRHERSYTYAPGVSLTIRDRFHNRTDLRWQSNLHFAHDLDPVLTATGFVVLVGSSIVRGQFEGEGCELALVRGETDPYQGWVSLKFLELTPAAVVGASCPADVVDTSWHITFQR